MSIIFKWFIALRNYKPCSCCWKREIVIIDFYIYGFQSYVYKYNLTTDSNLLVCGIDPLLCRSIFKVTEILFILYIFVILRQIYLSMTLLYTFKKYKNSNIKVESTIVKIFCCYPTPYKLHNMLLIGIKYAIIHVS